MQDTLPCDEQVDFWMADGRLSKVAVYLLLTEWRSQIIVLPKIKNVNQRIQDTIEHNFDFEAIVHQTITGKAREYFTELGAGFMQGHLHNQRVLKFKAMQSLQSLQKQFPWHLVEFPRTTYVSWNYCTAMRVLTLQGLWPRANGTVLPKCWKCGP